MIDKLRARAEAFETVLRGGVPVEGESEQAEIEARIVYDWLVRHKALAEQALAGAELVLEPSRGASRDVGVL